MVVARQDPVLTEAELLAHCKLHLTRYKMPHIVEFRSEPLPKSNMARFCAASCATAVRRRLLGPPRLRQSLRREDYATTMPATFQDTTVVRVWRAVERVNCPQLARSSRSPPSAFELATSTYPASQLDFSDKQAVSSQVMDESAAFTLQNLRSPTWPRR